MPMQARNESNAAEWVRSDGGRVSVLTGRAFGGLFSGILTAPYSTTVTWAVTNCWTSTTGCKYFRVAPVAGEITTASMKQLIIGFSTTVNDQANLDTAIDGYVGTLTTVTGTSYPNVAALQWETLDGGAEWWGTWDGLSKIKTIVVKVNTTVAADKKYQLDTYV